MRSGALVLHAEDLDLVELVTETVTRAERFLTAPATLTVRDLPEVRLRGDEVALGRALENLIVNAGTHGGAGVHIEVGAAETDAGLELFVDDDGPGVGADELDHIFEPFGRGDTARAQSGMGLGLSIVRDLVRAHGGDVHAASPAPHATNGRGTRFTLVLPSERILS